MDKKFAIVEKSSAFTIKQADARKDTAHRDEVTFSSGKKHLKYCDCLVSLNYKRNVIQSKDCCL